MSNTVTCVWYQGEEIYLNAAYANQAYWTNQYSQYLSKANCYKSASESCQSVSSSLYTLSSSGNKSKEVLSSGCDRICNNNKVYSLFDNIKSSMDDIGEQYENVSHQATSIGDAYGQWATAYLNMYNKCIEKANDANEKAKAWTMAIASTQHEKVIG